MSLQRSKSTPFPLPSLVISTDNPDKQAKPPTRSLSQHHLPAEGPVQPHHYYVQTHPQPPRSPWVHREDAFSLGGFFSASQDLKEWSWLHGAEREEDGDQEKETEETLVESPEDEGHEEEAIFQEDKMGILNLS